MRLAIALMTSLMLSGCGQESPRVPKEQASLHTNGVKAVHDLAATNLPPTARTLAAFKALPEKPTLYDVFRLAGRYDREIGSGIDIGEYNLDDGSKVLVGFLGDYANGDLYYIMHVQKDGTEQDLYRRKNTEPKPDGDGKPAP